MKKPKCTHPSLTKAELQQGATYRAKRPVENYITGEFNDRTILRLWDTTLQYDGPAVALGRHYPTTTIEKFLCWACHRVNP
jgi:hypothetical protein